MPKFLITREVPRAGQMSAGELQAPSQRACAVLRELGPAARWVQSHATAEGVRAEGVRAEGAGALQPA